MNYQWVLLRVVALVVVLTPVAASCGTDEGVSIETTTTVMAYEHGEDKGPMGEEAHGDGSHDHGALIDLSSLTEAPTVSVTAVPDGTGGVILEFAVTGLELVPADPPAGHRPGQGHLHVAVDGNVVAMTAETRYPVTGLRNGHHEVAVTLSANDHRNYGLHGEAIGATTTIMVTGGDDLVTPDLSFLVEVADGSVVGGVPRFEVSVGDLVRVTVTSDVGDEVHLHVYDLVVMVDASTPAVLDLEATVPGVFEAELHHAGFRVFELLVS